MNGLTLRVNLTGNNKTKNSNGFAPVTLKSYCENVPECKLIVEFIESTNADVQLIILKNILKELTEKLDLKSIDFLVRVFLEADAKHPVKCFLTRYVTKTESLQQPFTDVLTNKILSYINNKPTDYKTYIDIVSRLSTCIENFPAGAVAIKSVEIKFAAYLSACLQCCVLTLRGTKTLSPTEKNEIFNLVHLSLRLFVWLIQKGTQNKNEDLIFMFNGIRLIAQELLFNDDVPMDTKSVCGILYVSMHLLENGPGAWVDILLMSKSDEILSRLLIHEASKLSLYSAIATVVPIEQLQKNFGVEPLVLLVDKMLDIGERNSSDSVFILGVTRTLVQISKLLEKLTDNDLGLKLVDSLLLYVWTHLDHYMDSVRHLTGQALGCVVKYCSKLNNQGNKEALKSLFEALTSLDRTRKSYYVSLALLTNELGATCVKDKIPNVIKALLEALKSQPVQASATTALEILLNIHIQETTVQTIASEWIEPIIAYVSSNYVDSGVLNILEGLLTKAVKVNDSLMEYILPYIKQYQNLSKTNAGDLKCVLMLLNVAKKFGYKTKFAHEINNEWKGLIRYDVLKNAAVHSLDEIRILSLSLIVESPKSTEIFTIGDFEFVLWYLKYNINVQAPSFRQLTLSVMKKFVKRLDDSYKVLRRQKDACDKIDYYLKFFDDLRESCFDSLIRGANYSRRCVALQILVWCDHLQIDGYDRKWTPEYVDKLLKYLEDSYENNKVMALEVLKGCPVELLKEHKYTTSLDIKDILREASSLKPTDCISAAYKLDVLKRKLPGFIAEELCDTVEATTYALLSILLGILKVELSTCLKSFVCAARDGPMHGVLHCMRHFMEQIDPESISACEKWTSLIDDIILTCVKVNASVACVVNNSSPEGHLPGDMSGVLITDDGNSGGVRLDDGRLVTAQMVLLCAWRSVKEVSLLLGTISSRLSISGEGSDVGNLNFKQIDLMVQHFTKLLAETKHRGAFEQAYVGFNKLLSRLWRCRSPELHEMPRDCLTQLMAMIASNDQSTTLCATRRSAGLPFMIQALVITELQVHGNPKCFRSCMATLLRLAQDRSPGKIETRTHCLNILRALFRNSSLDECVAGYVGEGLIVALTGFEGETWAERNSSTLLFSALMVRIFGVQRSRDSDELCLRNKMTGRIFFLRYPHLYDFMLEKLKEVSLDEDVQLLRPSLYPILLLLARLYPSSLEGTVSNLKLVAYVPHVLSCANSSVLKTRQLAAKAIVPLVSPDNYAQHLIDMFRIISDRFIKRNYCHGILLQLTRLLNAKPSDLTMDELSQAHFSNCFCLTIWILEQDVDGNPCYLLIDEYVKVINLMVWKFPSILKEEIVNKITLNLSKFIFHKNQMKVAPGKEICISNALYLYLILLNKYKHNIIDILYKSLQHPSYEVILTTLNYLLILYQQINIKNHFQGHLQEISQTDILETLKNNTKYIKILCDILFNNKYIECQEKCLRLLTLHGDTQRYLIDIKNQNCTEEVIIEKLFDNLKKCHENLTHFYLESLCDFITMKFEVLSNSKEVILKALKMILDYSSSENYNIKSRVVKFLENNFGRLLDFNFDGLNEIERFQFKGTLWSIIQTMLEDDDEILRQKTANILLLHIKNEENRIPSKCREAVIDYIEKYEDAAIFVVLALFDFKTEECLSDIDSSECRIYDHNEGYSTYLEESIWTDHCAMKIIDKQKNIDVSLIDYVLSIIKNEPYKTTLESLCGCNISHFKSILEDDKYFNYRAVNPKVKIFIDKLSSS